MFFELRTEKHWAFIQPGLAVTDVGYFVRDGCLCRLHMKSYVAGDTHAYPSLLVASRLFISPWIDSGY